MEVDDFEEIGEGELAEGSGNETASAEKASPVLLLLEASSGFTDGGSQDLGR
jgi:hypothetical protein